MAIYHLHVKVISRAAGSSALAAAAYRSAGRLYDERLDRHHDFTDKAGVIHSEVLLPDGGPGHLSDRERLWNAAENAEIRKDAQLAREVEFAIPRELSPEMGIDLARRFVAAEFVERGMIADLNVHRDIGDDGEPRPHAHVMLTMRQVDEEGFGPKVRGWNRTDLLEHWREAWADHANARLASLDIDARIDHRSLEAQGIDLEPQHKIGPAAMRMGEEGRASERLTEHHAIARENGARIIARPTIALEAITHGQATFTAQRLAMFVHRHSEGKDQFDKVMAAVRGSPELVALGRDGRGKERFTSRAMLATEQRLERAAMALAGRQGHGLPVAALDNAITAAGSRGLVLGHEQKAALEHISGSGDLAALAGYAGTGKSALLGAARSGWESAGYRVRGAALSGIAAENLETGSGIASRTIASLEHQWRQGRDQLTARDVLVVDEAGMVGTRQMERVVSEACKRGAKLVLVGDVEQLQAIEAGAAFRSIAERHGAVEITQVRRQRGEWQRAATRHLATGRTGEAISAYAERGHVRAAATREAARAALIDGWDKERKAYPGASRLILTHTRDEVRLLNQMARGKLRGAGALGEEIKLGTAQGKRAFAPGDRIMFLRNERSLGVKNGSLGTVEHVSLSRVAVRLDEGRRAAFDTKDYADIDHGYAATIHKAQGATVDRVHILATPGLDRHAAYVAMTRHREAARLHYGEDDFADRGKLVRILSRERAKEMASDYARAFADRRAIRLPGAPRQNAFAGLKLKTGRLDLPLRSSLDRAVERVARAVSDITRMREQGYDALPHQRLALERAAAGLNALQPGGSRDMRSAFEKNRALIDEAAKGQTRNAIRAMTVEAGIRRELAGRADRFVADWQRHKQRYLAHDRTGKESAANNVRSTMAGMAKSLERDPQLESLLRNRVKELGIRPSGGMSLSQDLQKWLGLSRGRGIGR